MAMNRTCDFDDRTRRLAAAWLALAAAALGLSAVFALLLVLSRTPYVADWLPGHDFFHVALVLHVNLSSLVWFLAFAGALWTLVKARRCLGLGPLALAAVATGTLLMVLAPFAGEAEPVLSNYVPVLHHRLFLAGLVAVGLGTLALALRVLLVRSEPATAVPAPARLALVAAAGAVVAAALVLLAAQADLAGRVSGLGYYDALFWGAGHGLQFAHALLMLGAWAWLARLEGRHLPGPAALGDVLLLLPLLPALVGLWLAWRLHPGEAGYRAAYTDLMAWGGWLTVLPAAAWVLAGRAGEAVRLSVALFLAGALAGSAVRGDSVLVPAHYHGAIGAVTLAYMALTHRLLPLLGLAPVRAEAARRQLRLYGGGTLVLVLGLAIAGLLGVARKTSGAEQSLDGLQVLGMALMGIGGAVALAGALTFAFLVLRALRPGRLLPGGATRQAGCGGGWR